MGGDEHKVNRQKGFESFDRIGLLGSHRQEIPLHDGAWVEGVLISVFVGADVSVGVSTIVSGSGVRWD